MLRIVVRAKKDRDAVEAALKTFYQGWDIELQTLGGIRSPEEILSAASSIPPDKLTLLLLGRESSGVSGLEESLPLHIVASHMKYRKVRNARTIAIAKAIERAKASFRLGAKWSSEKGTYFFDHRGRQLFPEIQPAYDIFIPYTRLSVEALEDIVGLELGHPLLLRKMGGVHDVYDCGRLVATVVFPDHGRPSLTTLKGSAPGCTLNLEALLEANKEILSFLEALSLRFLRRIDGVEEVYVPLSGGKDSAVALTLAVSVYGEHAVRAVYIDTGVDFEENRRAAETLAEIFHVPLDYVYAPVREGIGKRGLPSHEDRWCTGLKVEALHRYLRRRGATRKTLVIVGDRDSESRSRSRRPPIRAEGEWRVAAPLKLWGTHHVVMYLHLRKVPLNQLYALGFYRTGCYICPSLRGWELHLMEKGGILKRLEARSPSLLKCFLASKGWLPGNTLDSSAPVKRKI